MHFEGKLKHAKYLSEFLIHFLSLANMPVGKINWSMHDRRENVNWMMSGLTTTKNSPFSQNLFCSSFVEIFLLM